MSDETEQPELTDEEQAARDALIYRYIQAHAPALLRNGVTFTDEQIAQIKALAAGRVVEAQRLILDELKAQEDSDE